MNKISLFFVCLCLIFKGFSQTENLKLTNVLVVSQQDRTEDRFTLEVNLCEILADCNVKAMPSLNILKQGADLVQLAKDSIQQIVLKKGLDTYVLVSVRGYDANFKNATIHQDLAQELSTGHLFPLYRDEISSVTLEFNFYRGGKFIAYDKIKLRNVSSRDLVIKRLRKKLPKRIEKYWK